MDNFDIAQDNFFKKNQDRGEFSNRIDVTNTEETKKHLNNKKQQDNYEVWSSIKKILLWSSECIIKIMTYTIGFYIFYLFTPQCLKNYWFIDEFYFKRIETIIYNLIIFFIGIVIGNFFNKHLD